MLAVVLVMGLAVAAAVTGAIEPRVGGAVTEARIESTQHDLMLRLEIDNHAPMAVNVRALTTDESRFAFTQRPEAFVVAGHSSLEVRVELHVRSCASISRVDDIPIDMVVGHWWGHRAHDLLTTDESMSDLAARACRGSSR